MTLSFAGSCLSLNPPSTTPVHGLLHPNIGRAPGPSGVVANHARVVAARLANTATDDIRILQQPGVLRCCNCGLAVTDSMKLPVFDQYDPILGPTKKSQVRDEKRVDYVRVVLAHDEMRTPSFEYSGFVACTPPCALQFATKHPDFVSSHTPHLHTTMMWERHRVNEPTVPAPPGDTLAYLNTTTVDGKSAQVCGLAVSSFYQLLSSVSMLGDKVCAPAYIPPRGEEEQTALQRHDSTYSRYYFLDLLPPHVAEDIRLPPELHDGGVQMDANPDSDGEADLATEQIHPPPAPPPNNPVAPVLA